MVLLAGWQALISGAGAAELEHRAMARIRGADGISVAANACPALDTFAATGTFVADGIPGIPAWAVYSASQARATFEFDAAGSRAVQSLVRIYGSGHEKRCVTRYLGSYEIEEHDSRPNATSAFARDKTLHRHRLGSALYTSETLGTTGPTTVRLAVVLTDHIGSTDVIVRGTWQASGWTVNGLDSAALNQAAAERQSFDAWGDRRNAANWSELRATDGANRQTSAMDYDRGFTGHEMLDDFGLIHMNGRIYDPEIGRFLSPDPYVQVPEYSQNFNRYTYVLNNPLSLTDPSGHSWVGDNWLSVVVMVVVAVVSWGVGTAFIAAAGGATVTSATTLTAFTTITAQGTVGLSWVGLATTGAIAGFVGGGLNAAVAGGNGGDILRGALVGAVQGAIAGGILHGLADGAGFENAYLHVAGHGTLGGAVNEAMGGKFQDGFLSGAAGAAAGYMPGIKTMMGGAGNKNPVGITARTIVAGVIGGTASVLGGGKFANGAYTAAFQHLLNAEFTDNRLMEMDRDDAEKFYREDSLSRAQIFVENKDNLINNGFDTNKNQDVIHETTRKPLDPGILKIWEKIYYANQAGKNLGECASLPRFIGTPAQSLWRKGRSVKDNLDAIAPGTAISNFNSKGRATGHAAIFIRKGPNGGALVFQQYTPAHSLNWKATGVPGIPHVKELPISNAGPNGAGGMYTINN
jgi:RHS repeat-associated protein